MLYSLRPAQTSDFERLLALERTSYRRSVEEIYGRWDEAEQRARFTRSFAANPHEVVEVEGEPVGVLSVDWDEDPVALHDVELRPDWQGKGLGTRLVHDVLLGARERGRAVRLRVLVNNPARALYERLGFSVTERSESHVTMRWESDAQADARLDAAMSPWADARRRRAWAHRLFAPPTEPQVGFARFVAGRYGLPAEPVVLDAACGPGRRLRSWAPLGWRVSAMEDDPDLRAAAARVAEATGPSITVVAGGLGSLDRRGDVDLAVVFDGSLWRRLDHGARVDAARRLRRALRPGGVVIVEGPNMPWILKAYREPPAQTVGYHRATVSRIPAHTLDFHDGVLEHRDTFVVEGEGEVWAQWEERRRLALLGLPQIRLALEQAGLPCIETFRDLDATHPARVTGRRIVLTARADDPSRA